MPPWASPEPRLTLAVNCSGGSCQGHGTVKCNRPAHQRGRYGCTVVSAHPPLVAFGPAVLGNPARVAGRVTDMQHVL
jgi:hypothetical protein